MAESVIRYKATDGTTWDTEAKADERDRKLAWIARVMAPLRPRPDDMGFANGRGYVQQSPPTVAMVKAALFREAAIEQAWYFNDHRGAHDPEGVNPRSHILGRILDDSRSVFYTPWCRLMCIDAQGREWGQPCYAEHPEKADLQEAIG